ncbi:MAG TPA: cytochrome P460 family protein [Terriglobales bacterium]|nr:cytochrome P460 family protein [Terriglobales bacterium]
MPLWAAAVAMIGGIIAFTAPISGRADEEASPIYGITIPNGYRDWKMIAVAQLVTGKVDQLRAQLGNEIAIKAFKEGKVPFPDGAIIAALHWNRVPSEGNNKVLAGSFPGAQSFVVGSAVNVQFMVKDSKKYAATGGWGFAERQTWRRGAAQNLLSLSRTRQRPRLCLHPLRALIRSTWEDGTCPILISTKRSLRFSSSIRTTISSPKAANFGTG